MEHENELQLLSFVLSTTFGINEAKEMVQHLRALAALSQDLGLIPSTSVVGSQPPSVPGDSLPLLTFMGTHINVSPLPSRMCAFKGAILLYWQDYEIIFLLNF